MSSMKTPGVYVVEKNAFPNSVVEVASAVPAFIGYTQFAESGGKSIVNTPWKISSMAEFTQCFGNAPTPEFKVEFIEETKQYKLSRTDSYTFYYNMRLFFANGGNRCYIVSVGNYEDSITAEKLTNGINTLLKEQEPTIVVIPEAVCLSNAEDCYSLQNTLLAHCGQTMNRFAILDIYKGYTDRKSSEGDIITAFRESIGTEFLCYGAAYYPWLNTSITSKEEVSLDNITQGNNYINELPYDAIKKMLQLVNLLPPSAGMAGVYTLTDNTKEVWKAPANTGIATVENVAVAITYADQEDLNVPFDGKAINAIRYFTGEGIKVWGARTLDGNSLDWRYINVRRTMIMLEESIKNAAKAFVFEPNVANTWVTVQSMISNFLAGIWRRGGLAGATPEDAFSVHVGLGDTMTPDDVLEGIMRITVLVAISRPAEFIEITFMQQMQKS
jgi:phage tail sheath protein FI